MYERSIEVEPNVGAYRNLASLYYFDHNFEDAARAYENLLALQDTDYRIWGFQANAYYWSGERAKAREAWKKMISMAEEQLAVNPLNAVVLGALAGAHAKIDEREQALAYVERLLALKRKSADSLLDVAVAYERLGERDLALHFLGEALDNGLKRSSVERMPWLDDLRDDPRY